MELVLHWVSTQGTRLRRAMPPIIGGRSIIIEVELFPDEGSGAFPSEWVMDRTPDQAPVQGNLQSFYPFGVRMVIPVNEGT